jgi:hypothetical protein
MEHLYSIPLASYAILFRELHFPRFVTGPSASFANAGALIRDSASPVAVKIARIRFFENIKENLSIKVSAEGLRLGRI